jgi:hypothetical protein
MFNILCLLRLTGYSNTGSVPRKKPSNGTNLALRVHEPHRIFLAGSIFCNLSKACVGALAEKVSTEEAKPKPPIVIFSGPVNEAAWQTVTSPHHTSRTDSKHFTTLTTPSFDFMSLIVIILIYDLLKVDG